MIGIMIEGLAVLMCAVMTIVSCMFYVQLRQRKKSEMAIYPHDGYANHHH